MSASCCMNNARASAGIEARESIGTAHQFTVGARPALVTRALIRASRHGEARLFAVVNRIVAVCDTIRVRHDFDILAGSVSVTSHFVAVVNCAKNSDLRMNENMHVAMYTYMYVYVDLHVHVRVGVHDNKKGLFVALET